MRDPIGGHDHFLHRLWVCHKALNTLKSFYHFFAQAMGSDACIGGCDVGIWSPRATT
jgi:hypothetical protein